MKAGTVRGVPAPLALLVCLTMLGAGCSAPLQSPPPGTWTVTGQVLDWDGRPAEGARVELLAVPVTTSTDADGRFTLQASGTSAWIAADHPDHHERVRAAWPDDPLLFRLSPQNATVVAFTGDMMADRRFYDADWPGPVLEPGEEATQLPDMLAPTGPMLASPDATVVNLEMALGRHLEPNPGKVYTFLGHEAVAEALADAGVDAVTAGNNHIADGQEEGVQYTLSTVQDAGLEAVGAGMDEQEAWQRIEVAPDIFVSSCTNNKGSGAFSNLAGPGKAGAAPCHAMDDHAVVGPGTDIMVMHAGAEFDFTAPSWQRQMAQDAVDAGFDAVLFHGSHYGGGMELVDGVPVAWGLGNFFFDSIVWPSLFGLVAQVHVWDGQVQRLLVEPVARDATVPHPMADDAAVPFLRRLAAESEGVVIEDGVMELDIHDRATLETDEAMLPAGIHRLGSRLAPDATLHDEDGSARTGWDLAPVAGGMERIMDMPWQDGSWRLTGDGGPIGPIENDGMPVTFWLGGEGRVTTTYRLYDDLGGPVTTRGDDTASLPATVLAADSQWIRIGLDGDATITGFDAIAWGEPGPWASHIRLDDAERLPFDWPRLPGGWGPHGPWTGLPDGIRLTSG